MHSRGPTDGYGFGNKKQYRRTLWRFIDDSLRGVQLKDRKVVYLDTKEGLETEFLLDRGYKPRNLHVVNWNPAEVAVLTRRLRAMHIPDVNTYGIDVFEAIPKVGDFHVLNLDLCGPISGLLLAELTLIAARNRAPEYVIANNMLRGRELKEMGGCLREATGALDSKDSEILDQSCLFDYTEMDAVRIIALRTVIKEGFWAEEDLEVTHYKYLMPEIIGMRAGMYKSTAGNQTMLWTAFHCRSQEEIVRRWREKAAVLDAAIKSGNWTHKAHEYAAELLKQ